MPMIQGTIKKVFRNEPREGDFGPSALWNVILLPSIPGQPEMKLGIWNNAPKGAKALDAIEYKFNWLEEGMTVMVSYTEKGKYLTVDEIQDVTPSGAARGAMPARIPDHLKPGPVPEEPLPDLDTPNATGNTATFTPPARPVGDEQAWRIARSVAIKECNTAATGGLLPALAQTWGLKTDEDIKVLASVMARYIVEG